MSSPTIDLDHKEISDNLKYLLDHDQLEFVRNILADLHAADIADLVERLDRESRKKIFTLLPSEIASEVLAELEDAPKEEVLEGMDSAQIAELVNEMDSDDATDVVSELSVEKATEVLSQVEPESSEEIQELLAYAEDTAGGIMAKEYIAVNADSTVQEAIEMLRKQREEVEEIYQIYVVDDFGTLVGAVSLKELILADPQTYIREIMDEEIIAIDYNIDQEEVAHIFEKYNLVSAPVVDHRHKLIGRITIDDVVDVINEETDEDIARIAGVGEEEILEESALKIAQARLPWLIISFFGEIISAFIMDFYSLTLGQILASAFFIPIVMAMGGSSGQQSAVIVVRGLATGEISIKDIRRRLLREIRTSIINGIVIAILILTVVTFWQNDVQFGAVLAISLLVIILNASIFGAIIPFLFKKINVDPALATGPFVATFNDVIGLLIYFSLLTFALKHGVGG
ncbi:MAG: magnesium transporter [Calditrichaeota bacterium]|nr:MAG: magnesium transporter [Calditrichota bacterium]